jgi:hypothetical protein
MTQHERRNAQLGIKPAEGDVAEPQAGASVIEPT